jgi:hypothetical protein
VKNGLLFLQLEFMLLTLRFLSLAIRFSGNVCQTFIFKSQMPIFINQALLLSLNLWSQNHCFAWKILQLGQSLLSGLYSNFKMSFVFCAYAPGVLERGHYLHNGRQKTLNTLEYACSVFQIFRCCY